MAEKVRFAATPKAQERPMVVFRLALCLLLAGVSMAEIELDERSGPFIGTDHDQEEVLPRGPIQLLGPIDGNRTGLKVLPQAVKLLEGLQVSSPPLVPPQDVSQRTALPHD
jgi:hypothetical protein